MCVSRRGGGGGGDYWESTLYVDMERSPEIVLCEKSKVQSYILQFCAGGKKKHIVLFVYALKTSGRIYRRLVAVVTYLVKSNDNNEE